MSAINRRSLTPLPSCCKTSSEKTRALAAWCMASQAFRSACRSSWKSFSRCRRHIEHDGARSMAANLQRNVVAIPVMLAALQLSVPTRGKEHPVEHQTFYRSTRIDGASIFYREAGPKEAPTLLLLHGLPSSSRMFEALFRRLSDRYHLVAPDYPGFGHSDWPDPKTFAYTFDHYAEVMNHFTEALVLSRYTLYMQDYGGPVGFRMALAHPDRIEALIVQD